MWSKNRLGGIMTGKEAIAMLKRMQEPEAWEPQINEAAFEALEMAIKALELEHRIIDNGYTGKEAEFRIGGKLFGIREKAQ